MVRGFNLLAGGGRRVEADRRGWKRAAALAAALIVSPLILTLAAALTHLALLSL